MDIKIVCRRMLLIILACFVTFAMMPAYSNAAATSLSTRTKAYQTALKQKAAAYSRYKTAKTAYDNVAVEYKKGAYGFYQWIIDTYSSDPSAAWKVDDATKALKLLNESDYRKNTHQGNSDDATDLKHVKETLALFPIMVKLRESDNNYKDLPAVYVTNMHMARAQVNANTSADSMNHVTDDTCSIGDSNENLAWGYARTKYIADGSPFNGWYYEEKETFDKIVKYVKDTYNMDYMSSEWESYYENMSESATKSFNAKIRKIAPGEVGHYCNTCAGYITVITLGETNTTYSRKKAARVLTGAATSYYGWPCNSLEMKPVESDDEYSGYGYTVDEYTALFNTYFNKVYPAAEDKALTAAKSAYDNARYRAADKKLAVQSLLKIKSMAARSGGKKSIKVSWKKVSGASGYEISVSKSKTKKIVVKRASARASSKTIKVKKKSGYYVTVRSYKSISGTRVYSSWHSVRKVSVIR